MAANIDWDAATAEATSLLREYIRVDTSNPPGNEERAVRFLGDILSGEGIAFETAESAPGRSNLIAYLGPGQGGVCLLNHTDVVPVEQRFWDLPAFAGELKDGFIWGRGALDMKGMGIIELMTFLLLKRQSIPLRRRVTFLAAADEEAGSQFGVGWLAEHRPQWLQADLVINEGAYGLIGKGAGKRPIFQVAPSEKLPLWVRLTARGRPGHGSVPHGDNCADRLVAALGRIKEWQHDRRILPLFRAHLEGLREAEAIAWESDEEALALGDQHPAIQARFHDTISLTMVSTGIKVNVIPAEATATLDCRLLPDVDPDEFLARLTEVIGDDRVELEVLNRFEGKDSPIDETFARVVREVISELVEGAHLVPEMTSGFTDSRIFRVRGVPAYGFVPCLVEPADLAGVHGNNERISVENLRLGMQVLYEVVRRLCC